MGLLQRISEYRERQIRTHAWRYVAEDEEILQWVRAKRVRGRGDGFVYLTPEHCVIHLSGRDGSGAIPWPDIHAWGLITDDDGGPILALDTDERSYLVRLSVATKNMADDVATFVERFAQAAPKPQHEVRGAGGFGDVRSAGRVDIRAERKSLATRTRKVALTLLGIGLIIVATLIGFIPGPWSIPLVLAGLAVLAQEYDWAKDLLDWFNQKRRSAADWLKGDRRRHKDPARGRMDTSASPRTPRRTAPGAGDSSK